MDQKEIFSLPLIEHEYFPMLINGIRGAQKKIYAIIYYAKIHRKRKQDKIKNLVENLGRKKQNGVDVRVLFNHSSERNFITLANKEVAEQLRKFGVLVKHTDTNRVTHAKLFLIDDNITFLGSHNLSTRSLHSNREVSLVTHTPSINTRLTCYFLRQFNEALEKW